VSLFQSHVFKHEFFLFPVARSLFPLNSSENKNHFAANLAKISQSSQQIYKLAKSHHWRKARGENKKIQNFIKDL
jgi:hypothetical protein